MGLDFYELSKTMAILLKQYGLSTGDVVHLILENNDHILTLLGGIWILGGICSISPVSTNTKAIEYQVSLHKFT